MRVGVAEGEDMIRPFYEPRRSHEPETDAASRAGRTPLLEPHSAGGPARLVERLPSGVEGDRSAVAASRELPGEPAQRDVALESAHRARLRAGELECTLGVHQ